ncbi:TetR/AcrR family transcriptional regulator [Devosia nitrariae]|uniref:TetR family transcriptional regulator n=1 Tax=Devosia nitrariae TaxID=2071872 RepID=A0ABQ5WB43_9HYPH|nr:TetR/AcrR family transcriptional regulator [Devosia nitrariae]GLQ56851.1 TetR family transcriptional regulator [Devosia nitrariae]
MNRIVKPAEIRREEILECALRLFSQQGYDATSVNQIIAALGLSKGAFYHHFAAKQDLIEALAVRFADDAARMASPVLEDESLDAFSRLSKFLASMRQSKVSAAFEVRNTFEPLFRPENMALFDRVQQALFGVVRPILTRIIADGVAERTFDTRHPDLAAETILHVMGSVRKVVTDLYAARNDADLDAAAAELVLRYDYMGTVVDRILGLPEGSIVLTDCDTIRVMMEAWRREKSAA